MGSAFQLFILPQNRDPRPLAGLQDALNTVPKFVELTRMTPNWDFFQTFAKLIFKGKRLLMSHVSIKKASDADAPEALRIVAEYYEAASVVAREKTDEFRRCYLGERGGFWMAYKDCGVVGCIALRELPDFPQSAEVKRMYVQPAHRRHSIANALLAALESFAVAAGYTWLYLDSAPGMDTAIAFYRRHGYDPCERYNDNPQANIFLRKRLV
jgi:GNAT superfamily N-acetyltransferase